MSDSFEAQGSAVIPDVLAESECQRILGVVLEERQSRVVGLVTKEGGLLVQPPASALESPVALRVRRDDAGPESGASRLVPGSHRFGRLDVKRAVARVPSFRRVLHFLFGPPTLMRGLRWA